jgi:hypothetical protein
MSHIKLIVPGSYEFGETSAQLIKVAAAGLRGDDLRSFIKRAGHKMADAMHKLSFSSGEVPIHVLVIGATEYYGPNRNGDGFTEDCCRKYHSTFVKHARWYRNHQNKDPKKSYGVIKHSDYNEAMHRIELIVALNGTKEAARRNGGLVADKELEKLAAGRDLPVSMACKVAYDVCSICGNRARTKDEYCTEDNCPGGGCAENLCKVAENGDITYVDNPHPTFFDCSDVYRGADRIAFAIGKMQKAASNRVVSSAELAMQYGVTAPFELELANITDKHVRQQLKIAQQLTGVEHELAGGMQKYAHVPVVRTEINDDDSRWLYKHGRTEVLTALAREKVSMSLTDFFQFMSSYERPQAEKLAAKVRPNLRGLFGRMCNDIEKLASDLTRNPYTPGPYEPTGHVKYWAEKVAKDASLNCESVQRRAWTHAVRDEKPTLKLNTDECRDDTAVEGLARAYGLYKLAFLNEIRDTDPELELTSNLTVRQNYVS